ncbi:MAG: ribose-phosphate diphosphokinase [Candidatus Nealsonbacteria bacterium]
MKNFIILTSMVEHLSPNLGKKLKNFELVFPEKNKEHQRCFPDGEVYMKLSRIGDFKNGRVVVLHSGAGAPANTNTGLMELELVLQILKDHRIKPEVFFTYFPYGRQDKVFEPGEANVAEGLVRKFIDYYKVRKIYTIDAHFGKMPWVKKYPIKNISAMPFLVEKTKKDFGENVLFLSPDKGGKRRTGIAGLNKKRINSFEVAPFSSEIPMKGEVVGVVDDIIETGGTLLRFCEFANNARAKKVIALITHGILDTGIKNAEKNFTKVYLANTVNKKEANVDITELIAGALNHKK